MSVFVIRHGKTPLNIQGKFNGDVDESLSEIGVAQAIATGEKLRDKKLDLIICSPLNRTIQTLDLLNLSVDIPVVYDERIIERSEGAITGLTITEEILNEVYLTSNPRVYIEGLEKIEDVFERVFSLLSEVEQNFKDKNVLLVTHGFISRIIYAYFNQNSNTKQLSENKESYQENCEIREYDFNKKVLAGDDSNLSNINQPKQ